ncbi:MAG: thiamine phosphate synthase [Porphyromonas sp.]|nr:thiamine phosphate synthase [Porphyromonas sp.]
MKVIIITAPTPIEGEAEVIERIAAEGVFRIHLRRPEWDLEKTRLFLRQFSVEVLSKIVLHDHHRLAEELPLCGVHFNRRNPYAPHLRTGVSKSVSCHGFDELARYKPLTDYQFLSPVFDSISKSGYRSGFTRQQLLKSDLIDKKVFALGGITPDRWRRISDIPFGGVAVLGDFWSIAANRQNYVDYLRRYNSH